MAIKLAPCEKCGETDCRWRAGRWKADWMLHDPEGYFEWSRRVARKSVEAEMMRERNRKPGFWARLGACLTGSPLPGDPDF